MGDTKIGWTDKVLAECSMFEEAQKLAFVNGQGCEPPCCFEPFPQLPRTLRAVARTAGGNDIARLRDAAPANRVNVIPCRRWARAISAFAVKFFEPAFFADHRHGLYAAFACRGSAASMGAERRACSIALALRRTPVCATKSLPRDQSGRKPHAAIPAPCEAEHALIAPFYFCGRAVNARRSAARARRGETIPSAAVAAKQAFRMPVLASNAAFQSGIDACDVLFQCQTGAPSSEPHRSNTSLCHG